MCPQVNILIYWYSRVKSIQESSLNKIEKGSKEQKSMLKICFMAHHSVTLTGPVRGDLLMCPDMSNAGWSSEIFNVIIGLGFSKGL